MAMTEPNTVSDHLRRSALWSFARACSIGCGSLPVSLPRSSRLPAPLNRVGERGAWASGFIAARRGLPRAGGGGEGVACFVGEGGNECVDFVDVLPIG